MVGIMPSLLASLLSHGSFGKSLHQHSQSSQLGARRELLPPFPSFFPSPRGAANLTGKHLTTTGPHFPGAGVVVSKALPSGPLTYPHLLLQSTLLMSAFPFMDEKIRPISLCAWDPTVFF